MAATFSLQGCRALSVWREALSTSPAQQGEHASEEQFIPPPPSPSTATKIDEAMPTEAQPPDQSQGLWVNITPLATQDSSASPISSSFPISTHGLALIGPPDPRRTATTSRIEALPTEVRQIILYYVVDDDDLKHDTYEKHARTLANVCPVFRDDVPDVRFQWLARKKQLEQNHAVSKSAFNAYIAELMAPVNKASKLLRRQNELPGNSERRAASQQHNTKRKEEFKIEGAKKRVQRRPRKRKSRGHQSYEDLDEAQLWRRRRQDRIADWKQKITESYGDYRRAYYSIPVQESDEKE